MFVLFKLKTVFKDRPMIYIRPTFNGKQILCRIESKVKMVMYNEWLKLHVVKTKLIAR
jgi:hypothetical protein